MKKKSEGTLDFKFTVTEHFKFNDLGPFTLSWTVDDRRVAQFAGSGDPLYRQKGPTFPVSFPVKLNPWWCMLGAGTVGLR